MPWMEESAIYTSLGARGGGWGGRVGWGAPGLVRRQKEEGAWGKHGPEPGLCFPWKRQGRRNSSGLAGLNNVVGSGPQGVASGSGAPGSQGDLWQRPPVAPPPPPAPWELDKEGDGR